MTRYSIRSLWSAFCNGNPENSPKHLTDWNDEPKAKSFLSVDIPGIIEKLDYLKELGINCLYLTPIFQSPSNHKYDIVNYFEIDSYFGTKEEFHTLVDRAHQLGIRIILDASSTIAVTSFPYFKEVAEKGKNSEYYDWFT